MTISRLPVTDEYVENGRAVVFVDGRLLVLSELATAALGKVGNGSISVDDLTALLSHEFGPPPTGDDNATTGLVDHLVDLGLLVWSSRQ